MSQLMKVLVTVKTYPIPSRDYMETVCTAGVLEDGSYVRLYPIDYRYKPYWQWYKKYQWIDVEVDKAKRGDKRPESYSPVLEKPIIPGDVIGTEKGWAERKKFVLAKGTQDMCHLNRLEIPEVSLGIVKPREITDFISEQSERIWKPEYERLFAQGELFGPDRKPIEKIPYNFRYKFKCKDPDCNGHSMIIEDWEIGQLYRNMRDKFSNEQTAVDKVKERFFDTMCNPKIDTHFFVGRVFAYPTWIILGVFWPPKPAIR